MALTDKQKQFCEEYLIDLNATQAAIRSGYSKNSAKEIGCQHLTKLNIQEYIQELKNKRSERVQITQDDIARDLIEIKDACKKLNPAVAIKALDQLAKHVGFYEADNKQKDDDTPTVFIIQNASERKKTPDK